MKIGFKHILGCLLLFAGLIAGLQAQPVMFRSSSTQVNRSWILLEQFTMADSEGTWVNFKLAHNHFNQNIPTQLDSTYYNYYDPYQGWMLEHSDCFYYDAGGQYFTEIYSNLMSFGDCVPQFKGIFTYDASDLIQTAVLQVADADSEWIDCKRVFFVYDSGNISQILTYDMSYVDDPPVWYKAEFMHDNAGRINLMSETMSEDSLNWTQAYRTSFLYHSSDTTTGASLVEMLSKKFPLWLLFNQPMEVGRLAEQINEVWMYQYWRNNTRDVYIYDNNNRLTAHQNYFNTMMGDWLNNILVSYTYDTEGNCESELQQEWSEDPPLWLDRFLTYNSWGQTTANDDSTVPVPADFSVSIYPNPFNDYFEFNVQSKSSVPVQIELYNIKGQKVYQKRISANSDITLDSKTFSSKPAGTGVYFLKATQGNHSTCKKLIRLK